MSKFAAISSLWPFFMISACSTGPETPAACIDRFSDDAELIDFLNNEIYGATYTYEIDDFDTFSAMFHGENGGESVPGTQFLIADGKAFMTIERAVPLDEGAVAFGCSSAPENSRLVTIQRERLARENEE